MCLERDHDFRRNNSAYSNIEHPRWGATQSVTTTKAVKAGQELFTFYGYGPHELPADFPWYWDMKRQVDKEERLEARRIEAERIEAERLTLKKAKLKNKTIKSKNKLA